MPHRTVNLEAPISRDVDYPSWQAEPLSGLGEPRPYDAVVTLYAWAQPVGWEVEELHYGFAGALHGEDISRVLRAAAWAHERWQAGDRVLVRCQAGLNRSGPVTALVLIMAGWDPAAALPARPVQPGLRAVAGRGGARRGACGLRLRT
jgi:hypothetical protein